MTDSSQTAKQFFSLSLVIAPLYGLASVSLFDALAIFLPCELFKKFYFTYIIYSVRRHESYSTRANLFFKVFLIHTMVFINII